MARTPAGEKPTIFVRFGSTFVQSGRTAATPPLEPQHRGGCRRPAAFALPCGLPLDMRNIGQVRGVWRQCSFPGNGKRELRGESTLHWDSVKLVLEMHEAVAPGNEQNLFAVRSPSENYLVGGMIGETPRNAARCWHHVHIEIPVVLAGESDRSSIGREGGNGLGAHARGE